MDFIWLCWLLVSIGHSQSTATKTLDDRFVAYLEDAMLKYPDWLHKNNLDSVILTPDPVEVSSASEYFNFTGEMSITQVIRDFHNHSEDDHTFAYLDIDEKSIIVGFYFERAITLVLGEFKIISGSFLNGIPVEGSGLFVTLGESYFVDMTVSDFEISSNGNIDLSNATFEFTHDAPFYSGVFNGLSAGGFHEIVGLLIWESYKSHMAEMNDSKFEQDFINYLKEVFGDSPLHSMLVDRTTPATRTL